MTPAILDEAARYAVTDAPTGTFSPAVCAVLLPALLDQRRRLARALLAAYPAYVVPRHHRPPTEGQR